MFFYSICGLSVTSEVELPGAIVRPADDRAPEVFIRRHAVPHALKAASDGGPTWAIDGDMFLLCIAGIARFLLTKGRDISFELEAGASLDDAAIFLVGTVFGILLHQRGQVALHGSAVCVSGKAVLFCGASGAGKSTLAAALGCSGYPLLADDICAIGFDAGGTPHLRPDGRQLKLWSHTIDSLDLLGRRGAPVRACLEKYYVAPTVTANLPLPVGAIYALREALPPHKPGIESPNFVDAALLLRLNAYRPLLVERMNQKQLYFEAGTKMANRAKVFHLTRVLDFSAMPTVVESLERHWRKIGLLEAA